MIPKNAAPSSPPPRAPGPPFPEHLRETTLGARDADAHRGLEEQLAALDDRWNHWVQTASSAPDPRLVRQDLFARNGLLKDALCDCLFSSQGLTEQRADALVQAATGHHGDEATAPEGLRAWRDEMSSLLRMALDEGRQGQPTNFELCPAPSLPSSSAHDNMVRAFQDVIDHQLLIDDALSTPNTAGHSHLLAALDLLDSASLKDLGDKEALVRYNELLQQVRTLEHQAVIEASAEGATSRTLGAVRHWLDRIPGVDVNGPA